MRPIRQALILIGLILPGIDHSFAVTDCMESIESLIPRAEIIVVGEILDLQTTPLECSSKERLIPSCMMLESLKVRIESYLVGQGPAELHVRVDHGSSLRLSCDNPYVLAMESRVIVFIRREGGEYLTVSDEASVYPLDLIGMNGIRGAVKMAKCSLTIALSEERPWAGQRVQVIHTLHNNGMTPVRACIVRPYWHLIGSNGRYGYEGWQDEFADRECFPEAMPGSSVVWVHTLALVDVGLGPASIGAALQLFDLQECETWPCGISSLASEPMRFELSPPRPSLE